MATTRLYLDDALEPNTTVALSEPAVAHLRARRARRGDTLELFNGHGVSVTAELHRLDRRHAEAVIGARRDEDRESPLPITLLQGISKGDRMDLVVQKATELGVQSILPVFTEHCVVRLDASRRDRKHGHWQRVAISACEQCGRNTVPLVASPQPLAQAMAQVDGLDGLLLAPDATLGSAALTPQDRGVALLIGPEGGLSDTEREEALARGWRALRLGPRVLRTETAAIAALTALQLRLGDLG